jgi:predicted glutamine amidotransferase
MCGIVAYISKWKSGGLMASQQKVFDQLLLCDMLRGKDATGVIAVHKDGDFSIMKEASDAYMFKNSYVGSEVDKDAFKKGVALIGHNRAMTVGENTDENAHPFVEDKTFAMVHNGTLRDHKSLHDTTVDSHALTIMFKTAMDEVDWKPAMEEALGKVKGAYACVWYDQKRDKVCMIRNAERPLAMITTPSGFVFSSEAGLAAWICSRNNEKVDKVESLDVHTLYEFDMKSTGGDFSKTFLSPKSSPTNRGFHNGITGTHAGTLKLVAPTREAIPGERVLLSKSAYKKLRSLVIGRSIAYWVEDYVDMVNNNSGECVQALLMGASVDGAYDLCDVNHEIRSVVQLKPLGLKESDLYGAVKCRGKVYDMEYDKDNSRAIIRVEVTNVEEVSGEVVH